MIKFKKIFLIFVLFLSLSLISCASGQFNTETGSDHISGVPFYEFRKFVFNDEQYSIFKTDNVKFIDHFEDREGKVIKYVYHEYPRIEENNLQVWTINYKQEVENILSDNYDDIDLIKKFYDEIESSLLEYSILLNVDLEIYKSSDELEKEFNIDMTNYFDSILVIDAYLPYKLHNITKNEEYIFYVPIKSFLAYKNESLIKVILDDEEHELSYQSFISSNNVYN